jgi:alpha-ketoglutarate-dependent taurine dioxygenase
MIVPYIEKDSSYEDILSNIDSYIPIFHKHKILAFKNLNLSVRKQKNLSIAFNKALGYKPDNHSDFHIMYKENHRHVTGIKENSKDKILIYWHLEHSNLETGSQALMAIWNMKIFKCREGFGSTGFVDSQKIFKELSSDHISFLDRISITLCDENYLPVNSFIDEKNILFESHPYAPCLEHPLTKEKTIRVDISRPHTIFEIDKRKPSIKEIQFFLEIYEIIRRKVVDNIDNQFWWNWSQNDVLIVDLFQLYHAVRGGFLPHERIFTGFWSFS